MQIKQCTICGEVIPPDSKGTGTRCLECHRKLGKYYAYCRSIHKTSPTSALLEFRNILLDFKYNAIQNASVPADIDYQFNRVNGYLAEDAD